MACIVLTDDFECVVLCTMECTGKGVQQVGMFLV